jgi:hypothetical protein
MIASKPKRFLRALRGKPGFGERWIDGLQARHKKLVSRYDMRLLGPDICYLADWKRPANPLRLSSPPLVQSDMTSCLLVKSSTRIVAVTDGRLSRDDNTQTFNATRKLIEFPISYRIPEFYRGEFDHFKEYKSEPWYLAYAGTHTITIEIIDLFRQMIEKLCLARDEQDGCAILAHDTPIKGRFNEDYYFNGKEYPKVTARDVRQDLVHAFETRGGEYSGNRGTMPDSQFILFGVDEASGEYNAFVVSADESFYRDHGQVRAKVDTVANGHLASIGSTSVRDAVYADDELMDGLKGWHVDEDPFADMDRIEAEFEGKPLPPLAPPIEAWSVREVGERFISIICTTRDPSVGGTMMLAEGAASRQIQLRVVEPLTR